MDLETKILRTISGSSLSFEQSNTVLKKGVQQLLSLPSLVASMRRAKCAQGGLLLL